MMRKARLLVFFILILLESRSLFAAQDANYLAELTRQAAEKGLAQKRYWRLLLHYEKSIFGGVVSDAAGDGFFLAPNGRTDPEAELAATLTKFFSDELVGKSKQVAQCAFVARYRWLKAELGFDSARLPEQRCDRFIAWRAALNPKSITLIFPSAYMNNPSSMFGHTLLRIDQKDQTDQTSILAYTVNYAATVTTENGVLFAVYGIFGGFKGNFSTIPYYIQVLKYSDMENRDIWEYRLNFTEEQLDRMLAHAWELGNTDFDYYFFKKNCSYQLLPLLEVANPELHLTDSFPRWTIPADTVRLIAAAPGLVGEILYRPSRVAQIRQKRALLTPEEDRLLFLIDADPGVLRSERFKRLAPERQALLLDVAYDLARYQSLKEEDGPGKIKKKQRAFLEARSEMKIQSPAITFKPDTVPPEKGHDTVRLGVGMGWREGNPFEAITLRPAYHDLLDDVTGYTAGAQIELMNAELRYDNLENRIALERLALVDIISLFPVDALFKRPSWKVSAEIDTLKSGGCDHCRYFDLNVGSGLSTETALLRREVFYFFLEVDGNGGRIFDPDYRLGAGGEGGILADITSQWKGRLFARYISYPLGDRSHEFKLSLQQRVTLQRDLALRLELNRRQALNERHFQNEALLLVHYYF